MDMLRRIRFLPATSLLIALGSSLIWAEAGILVVHVEDTQHHPIRGVQIGVLGNGGTAVTLDDGKARIALAPQTKEKSWVSLQILQTPPGKDFVMVSPWDYRVLVPSFQNEADNFVPVVVVQRGDRSALENGNFLIALAAKINQGTSAGHASGLEGHLEAVAREYGIPPGDLDKRIREWGNKTTDTYEAGIVALYARNFAKASANLENSLAEREKNFAGAQKDVADNAFFLGFSKYEEGKYKESVANYERCLQLRPDDPTVLNNLGQSVADAGDLSRAQELFERALRIRKATLGSKNADTVQSMDSLALLLQNRGKYPEAEALYRKTKEIREEILGPEARETVNTINSLAGVLYSEGKLPQAEELFRQALGIRQKREPDGLETAQTLDSLALCLQAQEKFDAAESDYRRALKIRQTLLPSDHPAIAQTINSLAWLLYTRGEFPESRELYEKALDMRKRVLGPNHILTATTMDGLGLVTAERNPPEGESLIRQALKIQEDQLGPNHPDVATSLDHLGLVLKLEGKWDEAEQSLRHALQIREKVLGDGHPATIISRDHVRELEKERKAHKPEG